MKRWLPLTAGIILVVLGGVAHGVWNNRWVESHPLDEAVGRLTGVPTVIGDWVGRDLEMDPRALQIAEIAGYVNRRFENRVTGQTVTIMLVCGKSGPIAVHTPDVCYGGAGFHMVAAPERQILAAAGAEPATFWTARVRKQDAGQTVTLRVHWAWNATGCWEAPDNPRLKFGRYPSLYKLYVVCEPGPHEDELAASPSTLFLQRLVPELQRSLHPDSVP